MKKFIFVKLIILTLALNTVGQNVAEEELKSVGKVEFENYRGSYKSVDKNYLIEIGNKLSEISIFNEIINYKTYSIVRIKPVRG